MHLFHKNMMKSVCNAKKVNEESWLRPNCFKMEAHGDKSLLKESLF